MLLKGPLQKYRDGTMVMAILAFAERLLLAINGHEQAVWNDRFRG